MSFWNWEIKAGQTYNDKEEKGTKKVHEEKELGNEHEEKELGDEAKEEKAKRGYDEGRGAQDKRAGQEKSTRKTIRIHERSKFLC